MQFLASRIYTDYTPESLEIGDSADSGFLYDNELLSLREIIRELRDCSFLSDSSKITGHTWASTDTYFVDYRTGLERKEDVHIRQRDGLYLTDKNMQRIYKLAGLK
jgi:hypothetical protein